MTARRLVAALCALALGVLCPTASTAAEAPVGVIEDPADFTPTLEPDSANARPKVYAFARSPGTIFAGGSFNDVVDESGVVASRRNVMSFDEATGELHAFAPEIAGGVLALEAADSALYVGGSFTSVNGIRRLGLAKLNPITGALDPLFDARLGRGKVTEIDYIDGRLIVAGTFAGALISLDPATGRQTRYLNLSVEGSVSPSEAVPTGVYGFSVNSRNRKLVAVGNFTSVGGQARPRAVMLALSPESAAVDPWHYGALGRRCRSTNPLKYAYLTDVDFSPGGRWFVLVSTGWVPRFTRQIGTTVCDAAARFEVGVKAPTSPTWINYTGGDTLYSVEVTGDAVYVQGHNRWLDNPYGVDTAGPGSVKRRGLGAIDPRTGAALPWNPDKPAVQGGHAFLATHTGLWVGSDSPFVGGEYHRGLAYFPAPPLA